MDWELLVRAGRTGRRGTKSECGHHKLGNRPEINNLKDEGKKSKELNEGE